MQTPRQPQVYSLAIAVLCLAVAPLGSWAAPNVAPNWGSAPAITPPWEDAFMTSTAETGLDGAWRITEMAGSEMPTTASPKLEFYEGTLYADGPCNTLTFLADGDDGTLSLILEDGGNAICAADVMERQRTFVAILERVSRYELGGADLVLRGQGIVQVRAVRAD